MVMASALSNMSTSESIVSSVTSATLMSPLLAPTVPQETLTDVNMATNEQGSLQEAVSFSSVLTQSPSTQVHTLRSENKQLRSKLRQLQSDYQQEIDTVSHLRKKLNDIERERLDATSKGNEEITRLQTEVTKQRAQQEKGEALRQNLEFQLAKSQQETNQEKRSAADKEGLLNEINDTLKQKTAVLTAQIQQLQEEIETQKAAAHKEISQLRLAVQQQDKHLSHAQSQQDVLEKEKEKLETTIQQLESAVSDLEEKLKDMEDEKKRQGELVRKQVNELDLSQDREQRFKKDLEVALARIHHLEESIEAERASHLESKFNSEIIQLRIRDLEGALEVEKTGKTEALAAIERLNTQLREVQNLYDEERKSNQETKEKLSRVERDLGSSKKQLSVDLEDKKKLVRKMSSQLEIHQKNFNELKEELSKAKKRQAYLEETYGGSMRELELLLHNFKVNSKDKEKKKKKKTESSEPVAPSVVLENLRLTMLEYKARMEDTTAQLNKMKNECEKLSTECASYKDMIWVKDKTLEDTKHGLNKASKDLHRAHSQSSNLELTVDKMRQDLESAAMQVVREQQQSQDLQNQMTKLAMKYHADDKAKLDYLRSLYKQLVSGRFASKTQGTALSQFGWSDLTTLINEQVGIVQSAMARADDKMKTLEEALASKQELVQQIQEAHEEQMERLATITHGRTEAWSAQKSELEQHYSQLLAEIHSRHKKTQLLADQAWEKVRVTGSIQQGLETECSQLRAQLSRTQSEYEKLQIACILLAGALHPLCIRVSALISQRHLLEQQLLQFDWFRQQTVTLVKTLSVDEDKAAPYMKSHQSMRTPLLTFRIGAIAVMAANRLVHLSRDSSRMFVAQDVLPGNTSASVHTGGIKLNSKFQGIHAASTRQAKWMSPSSGQKEAVKWLGGKELVMSLAAAITDIHTAMSQRQETAGSNKAVILAAKGSFLKLMETLSTHFDTLSIDPSTEWSHGCLARMISHGLNRVLAHTSLEGKVNIISSQSIINHLQQHILEFTQRLRTSEVERRDLRAEVGRLSEGDQKQVPSEVTEQLQHEIITMKQHASQMVSRDRFDSLCQELNNALRREQQAQQILNEQSLQLRDLSEQLDSQISQENKKEKTLSEAVQELSEAKMDIKRREQAVRQLKREISRLETEKQDLVDNVRDAENALCTAAKDKEALHIYMTTVQKHLEKLSTACPEGPPELNSLLSSDLMPVRSKLGPELIASQILVGAFVDAYRRAIMRTSTLEEEIFIHKQHILRLKDELSAACQREYDNEELAFPSGGFAGVPSKPWYRTSDLPQAEKDLNFKPLIEDTEQSCEVSSVSTPKAKMPKLEQVSRSPPQKLVNQQKQAKQVAGKSYKKNGATR